MLKFPLDFQDAEEYAKKNIREPTDPRPQKQQNGHNHQEGRVERERTYEGRQNNYYKRQDDQRQRNRDYRDDQDNRGYGRKDSYRNDADF